MESRLKRQLSCEGTGSGPPNHLQADRINDRRGQVIAVPGAAVYRCRKLKREVSLRPDADLTLASVTQRFCRELQLLGPFGEGNPAPVFRICAAEVVATRQRRVCLRQGSHTLEAFDWRVGAQTGQRGDWLVEFRSKGRRILLALQPK